jgi:hypothetical protein
VDAHRFTRVTAAVGLLGLASLALIGCQQESRYCDDTGCFYCDGLGCRTVNPPGRAACDCPSDCIDGTTCTSLGCATTCTDDAAGTELCHSLGWPACRGGVCVANAETTVTTQTCSCTASTAMTDCHDGRICHDGECVDGCSPTMPCATDQICIDGTCQTDGRHVCSSANPCEAGSVCVDGECRVDMGPGDETCQFNSECGAGRVCVNQRCTEACSDSNPCPTGAVCEGGFCHEQLPPTGTCTVNTDCTAGQVCIDGRCLAGCTGDADCAAGNYCDTATGVCRFDDRLHPGCGPLAGCAMGSICVNGSCRSPCSTDAQCPLFDVQFNFCRAASSTASELVCVTTNEATSDCASAADCMTGEDCVDGVCR